jgi:hypothetical protein
MEPDGEEADLALQTEDQQEKNDNDLLFASKSGQTELALRLLNDGARHGVTDDSGWTPLLWAACNGHDAIVEALLEHGAHIEYMPKDAHGAHGKLDPVTNSPLHWAAFKGHTSIVWRLLAEGVSPLEPDAAGNNSLHLGASGGHLAVVKACLSAGLDSRAKNLYGNTPLALATAPAVRELLKSAEKAAADGKRFLCAVSGRFCAADECFFELVADRVSHPVRRPACYAADCRERFEVAEDALACAIEGSTAVEQAVAELGAALAEAEAAGASMDLLLEGEATLARLAAEMDLAAELKRVDACRPHSARGALKALVALLEAARAQGAAEALLEHTEASIQCMLSEIALQAAHAVAAPLSMAPAPPPPPPPPHEPAADGAADDGASAEAPPAPPPPALAPPAPAVPPAPWQCPTPDGELALKAKRAVAKLEAQLAAAHAARAETGLVATSERLLALLLAERDLRDAHAEPAPEPPSLDAAEGAPAGYAHASGHRTASLLESLALRATQLDEALSAGEAAGVHAQVLATLEPARTAARVALAAEQVLDDERKAKDAAAAAKGAKKGKKKK